MKTKTTLLVAVTLILSTSIYAQGVGGGGGIILDSSGQIRLEDLVKQSLCRRVSFASVAEKSTQFQSMIRSIEGKNWFLADFFARESKALQVCFTGRLKKIPVQDIYEAQYGEERNWKNGFIREQLGVRLGDTVFINQALYELPESQGGLPASDIATFLVHEISHGIIPDSYNGMDRSTLVSQFAYGIHQNFESLMDLASFDELIRSNGIQMPLSDDLARFQKYRSAMQQAFLRTSTIRERYLALAQLPLRDLADWIQPVERAHLVQKSNDELKNARRIIRSVNANSTPRRIDDAITDLKIEMDRGILPTVLTYTAGGVDSLLEEALRIPAYIKIIDYLRSVKATVHYDENDDRFSESARIYFSRDINSQFKSLQGLLAAGMNVNVRTTKRFKHSSSIISNTLTSSGYSWVLIGR